MPRCARIDIPGVLQHVIVRGIERCEIFRDDEDRQNFVDRFASLLVETRTECYAWSLLSNHFHLLIRSRQQQPGSLSSFMRRLLTGYAVSFNRRHRRSGHLFQNRYKSIVCEEEPYLLELVRYIHLNPLRAGLVQDMAALDHYPWSGHRVLAGHGIFAPQNCDSVLALFGMTAGAARAGYRTFVDDGITHGRQDELVGGGMRRMRKLAGEGIEAADERILGSSDFVESLRGGDPGYGRLRLHLGDLIGRTAGALEVEEADLLGGSRVRAVAEARSVICFLATREYGISGEELGKVLRISRSGVCRAARRGQELVRENRWLNDTLTSVNKSTTSPPAG